MNVVAFSLFGSSPVYCQGALRNAEQWPKLLPGWKCVFYVAGDVPQAITLKLKQAGADVREPPVAFQNRMFDRFTVLDDLKVQRALFRDTDSRPGAREIAALQEWLAGAKPFHSMADHPCHTLPLGGGLWAVDLAKFKEVPHLLRHVANAIVTSRLAGRPYKRETSYSLDQTFLTRFVWPLAKAHGVLRHDLCCRERFPEARDFPAKAGFDDLSFVGEILNERNEPNWNQRLQRLNFLSA